MDRNELLYLQSIEDYPLVSILMPTNKKNTDGQQEKIRLKNLVQIATKRLQEEFKNGQIKEVQDKLISIPDELNYNVNADSYAIYIGKDHRYIYELPFPVEERVIVDTTFATRDIVFAVNRSKRYRILVLSDKICRLLEGSRNSFKEIKNDRFPVKNKQQEEYNNGMERNTFKGLPKHQVQKDYFREVDGELKHLDPEGKLPLALVGVERNISLYKEITKFQGKMIAEVNGNYEWAGAPEITKLVWPEVKKYFAEQREIVFKELQEAVGRQGIAFGAEECWKMAKEGRGKTLLVEINYKFPAIVDSLGYELTGTSQSGETPEVIDDAIDELIELVISKGGDVYFYDNEVLKKYKHVALIARY
ncbi:MAG: hypothetical protein EHM58_04295 [Ignavibacteriae bacterium]|nr:MAG: hypothetical protein EHM58_04295 [Ignavibacteriota bacterium]